MNILTSSLPSEIYVMGKKYSIDTDFRQWLKFARILEEKASESETEKILYDICKESIQESVNPDKLLRALINFFIADEHYGSDKKSSKKNETKTYDFDFDSGLIYAAFLQFYHIDLIDIKHLHWWRFRALLNALNDTTKFVEVIGYRNVNISKIKDKEQRNFYRNMKRRYTIKEQKNEHQKEQNFNDSFVDFFI